MEPDPRIVAPKSLSRLCRVGYVSVTEPYHCSTKSGRTVCHTGRAVHRRLKKTLLASLLAAFYAQASVAQNRPCTAPSAECAVVGHIEVSASIGLGQRSNPIEGKSDIPL